MNLKNKLKQKIKLQIIKYFFKFAKLLNIF